MEYIMIMTYITAIRMVVLHFSDNQLTFKRKSLVNEPM